MSGPLWASTLLLCILAAGGCSKSNGASASRSGSGPEQAASGDPGPPDTERPATRKELPTTPGALAFSNLNSQIQGSESALALDPKHPAKRLALVDLIATRGQYSARVADYERAAQIADEVVRDAPGKWEPLLARASTRATLHRFTEALADLDEVDRLSPKHPGARSQRAAILQARGQLEEALVIRRASREAYKNIMTLGNEAALLGDMGKLDEAARLFREAAASYRDVSPFPVAWLFFQEGLMWERAGQRARAKSFFAAAHERLPAYAHAASHLAQIEAPPRALELLAPIVAASDDPEFELLLAQRLQDSGRKADAEPHLARVRARYDELVRRHPAAFADHAGWFWLDEGKDPKRALELAKLNLETRKTEKAYELALLAAIAANSREEGCALAEQTSKLPNASEMLRRVSANACPK